MPSTIYQTRFGSGQNVNSMIAVMDIDMETRWDSTCSYDYFRVLRKKFRSLIIYTFVARGSCMRKLSPRAAPQGGLG